MHIVQIEQNTPEWLEFRRTKIGGSDVPIILGVSPYKTPFQLYKEKTGEQSSSSNVAMERGKLLEQEARELFSRTSGVEVDPIVVQHDVYDFMIASLDGWNEEFKVLVEIKCPGKKDHSTALEGNIPAHYYPQLQHQMAVTGVSACHYFSYDGSSGTVVLCPRNDEYIAHMIEKEKVFMEALELCLPPEMTDKDEVIHKNEELIKLANEYEELREQGKEILKKQALLKEKMFEHLYHPKNKIGNLSITKIIRPGIVNYELIPELRDVDLDIYRNPQVEFWQVK